MRIAIMGAGGIGSFYAARLSQAGANVALIARGDHLTAIRRRGLHVEGLNPPVAPLRLPATDRPAELAPVDVVLLCTKMYDIEEAARALLPALHEESFVLTQQNGVEAGALIRPILGTERVIDGVSYVSGHLRAPGVVQVQGAVGNAIEFGEADSRPSVRTQDFAALCARAGITARVVDDIEAVLWHKFIIAASFAGVMALTRLPVGQVRRDPHTRRLLGAAVAEAEAVAHARGVQVAEGLAGKLFRFADALPAELTASMLEDLQHGRRLEVAWLSGAVERLGHEVGIETPVHTTIYAGLKLHAAGTPAH